MRLVFFMRRIVNRIFSKERWRFDDRILHKKTPTNLVGVINLHTEFSLVYNYFENSAVLIHGDENEVHSAYIISKIDIELCIAVQHTLL